MARWDDGYVTDVAYTTNFYREITPIWLTTTSLLLGQRPPDLSRPFRYADLGCGNGFTALAVAASCPEAEVWGFDFNPAHVEWATRLAAMADLPNVRFVETSFAELASRPLADLPQFDFMVSHGVLSWISPENQRLMMEVIRQRLRPGGLSYISYNVTTGWAGMVPVRALMRMLTEANPARTDLAVTEVLDFVDRLKSAGAAFFQANPALDARMADIRRQDARYVAHEYLNRDWHPTMFSDVARAMGEAKCSFIGSATLTDNIDAVSAPSGVVPLLTEARDLMLRETLRDFGSAQAFRRDVFRRGQASLPAAEQQELVNELAIAGMGQTVPDPITFVTAMGSVTGRAEIYKPLLDALAAGPLSVQRARELEPFTDRPLVELLQAFTLVVAGGYGHPVMPGGGSAAARQATRRLNRAVAEQNANGGEVPRLVAPLVGSALQVDLLESLIVGELLAGRPAEVQSLASDILAALGRCGRSMQREGKPITDAGEARSMAEDLVRGMLDRRAPVLRSLGVLDG